MNETVLNKARELAAEIAKSPEFIAMRVAEEGAAQNEELTTLFARYAEKEQDMEKLTCEDHPDFEKMGALSAEMQAIKDEIQSAPLAHAMQVAQRTFADMMRHVNAELQKVLAPENSAGCGGNCASCHYGCSHQH